MQTARGLEINFELFRLDTFAKHIIGADWFIIVDFDQCYSCPLTAQPSFAIDGNIAYNACHTMRWDIARLIDIGIQDKITDEIEYTTRK